MVIVLTAAVAPRSTRHHLLAPVEHHLSPVPPETLPLTALAGPSPALQDESAVAGLFRARFADAGGAVSHDGGASAAAAPQDVAAVVARVRSTVPPALSRLSGSHGFVVVAPLSFALWYSAV
jgi:hypothetical protein